MSQPASSLNAENPWPGLATFEEADREFFRGRSFEAAQLFQLVQRETLTVLFGRSGLGKTSLLNAGLYPLLREQDFLPVHIRLDHSDKAAPLLQQVWQHLREACEAWAVQATLPAEETEASLWAYFHHQDCEFWSRRNRLLTPVIVFDQFEEIFTLGQQDAHASARAAAFLSELADLVENRAPGTLKQAWAQAPALADNYNLRQANLKLLLSFREDFLAAMEGQKDTMPSLMYNRLRLLAMDGAQAFAVVTEAGGALLDASHDHAVARSILHLAWENQPGSPVTRDQFSQIEIDPALLSVVCSELNQKRQQAQQPQITMDLLAGADSEILSGFYARSMEGLGPGVRAFVEDELINQRGYRDSHDYEDAIALPGVGREAIETLIARRLLRKDERQGKAQARLELTHDVLTRVVAESRDQRKEREAAAKAAAEQAAAAELAQQQAQEQARAALAAQALAQAQEQAAAAALELARTREQAAQAAQARNKRNARLLLLGLMVMLLLVGVATLKTMEAREAAGKAEQLLIHAKSVSFMTQADRMQEQQYDLSLLLNLEALRVQPTQDAKAGLLRRFNSQPHLKMVLTGHQSPVNSIAISPDGKLFASAGNDQSIVLWDAAKHTPIATLQGSAGVMNIAFSPDGKFLASGASDGTVSLWDVARRVKLTDFSGHKGFVSRVSFSPNGKLLASASASWDKTLILWDVASGAKRATLAAHAGSVLDLAFSPDGKLLASAGVEGNVILWDVATGAKQKTLIVHNSSVLSVAFSPDGKQLAAGDANNKVILWDMAGGDKPATLSQHTGVVSSLAFSPDGKSLASGSSDKSVIVWDVARRRERASLKAHAADVNSVIFSLDSQSVISAGSDGKLILWDPVQSAARSRIAMPVQGGYPAFSRDGKLLAMAGEKDGSVLVMDVKSGANLARLTGHESEVRHIAFSPDAKLLASAEYGTNTNILLWDVATGAKLAKLNGDGKQVTSLAFSDDGKLFTTAKLDDRIILWDVAGKAELSTIDSKVGYVTHLAFSPDHKLLAVAGGFGEVTVWDIANKKELASLPGHTNLVTKLAFSPDGKTLASASWDNTVILWDLARRVKLATLWGHQGWVNSVSFSPDGNVLASASDDNSVMLWDVANRTALATLRGHTGSVREVVFTPDGKSLVSIDFSGTTIRWNLDPAELMPLACHTANRNLTCNEWRQYISADALYQKTCPALPGPDSCP